MLVKRGSEFSTDIIIKIMSYWNNILDSNNSKERYIRNKFINFLDAFSDSGTKNSTAYKRESLLEVISFTPDIDGIDMTLNDYKLLGVIADMIYLYHRRIVSISELTLILDKKKT